jgi:hypothetical protein
VVSCWASKGSGKGGGDGCGSGAAGLVTIGASAAPSHVLVRAVSSPRA